MNKVFICGYYGFDNVGDEAILASIIDNIKRFKSNTDISVLTYNSQFTRENYNVKAISRSRIFSIIKTMKDCDLLIFGGGSLLQDVTSSKSLIFYLGLIFLAKLFGKKIMFYCSGYGPVNRRFNKLLIKLLVSKVDLIHLRDQEAKKELKRLNITENVLVTGDATFTMKPTNEKRIDEIISNEGLNTDKKIIGFSVRNWKNDDRTKREISKVIDHFEKENIKTVLIPMKYPDDVKISLEIKKLCEFQPEVIEKHYTPKEVLGLISRLDLLVGVRLHALIFAAISNVPMVGIEYDPKVKGFLDSIEGVNNGPIEEIDSTNLCLHISDVLNNREKYKEKLTEKKKELEEKVLLTSKKAIELLEK
ncbi:polysaccharide pyruvyl transferase CsaB [Dethiothermospora halolimnae]|uniref:polysaccharide pyruvyl transferase CsaB n=1 Tax=Dethiothermospora halolimnae TaxID=3114390 RepID=UPI003CCB8914